MEALIILILIAVFLLVIVLPIWTALKSSEAMQAATRAESRLRELAAKMQHLQDRVRELEVGAAKPAAETVISPRPKEDSEAAATVFDAMSLAKPAESPQHLKAHPASLPPPLPVMQEAKPPQTAQPPPQPPPAKQTAASRQPNIEQFMGTKLMAWAGGLALFLGLIFFVQHAFRSGWIEPPVRTAIGYAMGSLLLAGGMFIRRFASYSVLAQTLCATGVVTLYGVTFAAHSLYKFPLFTPAATFGILCALTAGAFVLAARMDALVIAILGMLGGFLAPVLVSTGEDRPLSLFGYIAVLDIGLLALARSRKWHFLAALAAAGTLMMQCGWMAKFYGGYENGWRTLVPMGVFSFFTVLFLAAARWTRRTGNRDWFVIGSALGLGAAALAAGFVFLASESISSRPLLLYGYVFLINAAVLAAVVIEPRAAVAQAIAGAVTFIHLASWTQMRLSSELLVPALACYLVFGLLHSVFPLAWRRLRPDAPPPSPLAAWTPLLSLLLMLMPIAQIENVSFTVWPAILLANLAVITAAAMLRSLPAVAAAVVLTLVAAGIWLFRLPAAEASIGGFLLVVGFFAIFHAVAGSWLAKRLLPAGGDADLARQLPCLSSAMPFLLLVMATLRLPMPDPSLMFALSLLLVAILLALSLWSRQPFIAITALACVLVVQFAWHHEHYSAAKPWPSLLWHVAFALVFMAFPFMFRSRLREEIVPWAAAALSGIGHFPLVYEIVDQSFKNDVMGLLPLAFAVPPLASLLAVLRWEPDSPFKVRQLAWFGGAALFFITLAIPVQFEKETITLGWALEGAALIWLFLRVPHPGLRIVGAALLAAAFVRLALNPAVLTYHPRGTVPVLNWHLYTYGIAALAHFMGAFWLRPPDFRLGGVSVRSCLWAMGGILLFLLLNIEIADCFTTEGERFIAFKFGNDFARDMTYSIAWSLFALLLIVLGFWKRAKGCRHAGIGLLAVTLLKLFLHDLSAIGNVYRIAALMAVAVIALAASFLYQRFFDREDGAGRG